MLEVNENLWNVVADYYCVTTNGILKNNGDLVMGKGIAKEASLKFPHLPKIWGKWVLENGNTPCFTDNIISFPTKHHWKDPSDLNLIVRSAKIIVEKTGDKKVALTRPGCGNGQLLWDNVKKALNDILGDRFIVVYR